MKCDCLFRVRGYMLSVVEWNLRVQDEEHNHEMVEAFQKVINLLDIYDRKIICLFVIDNLDAPSNKYFDHFA